MNIPELQYINSLLLDCDKHEKGVIASKIDLINIFTAVKTIFEGVDQKATNYDELNQKIIIISETKDIISNLFSNKEKVEHSVLEKIYQQILKIIPDFLKPKKSKAESLTNIYNGLIKTLDQKETAFSESLKQISNLKNQIIEKAQKWEAQNEDPKTSSVLQARHDLREIAILLNQLKEHSSEKIVLETIDKSPTLLSIFDNNIESVIAKIEKKEPINPLIKDKNLQKKVGVLLGESPEAFTDILILRGLISERTLQQSKPTILKLSSSLQIFTNNALRLTELLTNKKDKDKESIQWRGLELTITEKPDKAFWLNLIKLAKSDIPIISLSIDSPEFIQIPPQDLSPTELTDFYESLKKIELIAPTKVKFDLALLWENQPDFFTKCYSLETLDLSQQRNDLITKTLSFLPFVTNLNLANTNIEDSVIIEAFTQGYFSHLKEFDLSNCKKITTDILYTCSSISAKEPNFKIQLPEKLSKGELPLPNEVYVHELLADLDVGYDIYPKDQTELSPEIVVEWLKNDRYRNMKPNPYMTTLNANGLLEVNNQNLPEFLKKFPNLKVLNLKGCTNITDDLLPSISDWLANGKVFNIIETEISITMSEGLQTAYPHLKILDFVIITNTKNYDFSRHELVQIPYWKNEFARLIKDGKEFELEYSIDKKIDSHEFDLVYEFLNEGTFSKKQFTKDEAANLLTLSTFFGKSLENKCWEILTNQILESKSHVDLNWIEELGESYTNQEIIDLCRSKRNIRKRNLG